MIKRYFYVIAPVGADPAFPEKKRALVAVGSAHKMEPWFPLDHHATFSPSDAIRDMRESEFVMADVSRERPSCYYELGLAEASGADVMLMAETGTRIHQVRDPSSVTFYSDLDAYCRIVGQMLAGKLRTSVR